MNSNYPRADEDQTPRKPRVAVTSIALAFIFHVIMGGLVPSHPLIGLTKKWFSGNGDIFYGVAWVIALIVGLTLMWRSSEWRFRKKLALLVLTGVLASVLVFPLDSAHRGAWRFNEQDASGLLIGFCVVSVIYAILFIPIWTVAYFARKRSAKGPQRISNAGSELASNLEKDSLTLDTHDVQRIQA